MSSRSAETGIAFGGSRDRSREAGDDAGLWRRMQGLLRPFRRRNGEGAAKDPLEELIEEREEAEIPLGDDERLLLANILALRDRAAEDVMVPRADIVAIDSNAALDEVVELMTRTGHSRIPVYRETLDDAVGMIHIKDILAWRGQAELFRPAKVLRQVLFVAPSMEVLELLLEMRVKRCHMALVVDEFGGV
ncbi:MAG: CBS domain-containing protein, partial [Rhodospirillales bacterium]